MSVTSRLTRATRSSGRERVAGSFRMVFTVPKNSRMRSVAGPAWTGVAAEKNRPTRPAEASKKRVPGARRIFTI